MFFESEKAFNGLDDLIVNIFMYNITNIVLFHIFLDKFQNYKQNVSFRVE
jgi:hypothetical protein